MTAKWYSMADDAIIFAMAINTRICQMKKGGTEVIATGRSDFPNQINNVMIFPESEGSGCKSWTDHRDEDGKERHKYRDDELNEESISF